MAAYNIQTASESEARARQFIKETYNLDMPENSLDELLRAATSQLIGELKARLERIIPRHASL